MSKYTSKLLNNTPQPRTREVHADLQRNNFRLTYSKWDDPGYLAGLEAVNLMRESEKLMVQTASEVVARSKIWLYPDWLPQDELTVAFASPLTGKTNFVCSLAAGITRGNEHGLAPGLTPTGQGHVIIVNQEDDITTSLTPRLKAAGADLTKVHFIGCKGQVGQDSSFSFASDRDMARLEGFSKVLKDNLGLIIIDPIYFAVDGDHNNNHKAREAYERLAHLAKRLSCAILGVAHTVRTPHNKTPLARLAGPPALREVPRAIILLSKRTNGPSATGGTHVLVHVKNNEGTMDGGYEFRHEIVTVPGDYGPIKAPKLIITAPLAGTAENILEEAERDTGSVTLLKSDIAARFLRDVLAKGPRLKREVLELAEKADIRIGTLHQAKASLKIVTRKRVGDGFSVWSLPDAESAEALQDESPDKD